MEVASDANFFLCISGREGLFLAPLAASTTSPTRNKKRHPFQDGVLAY